MRLGGWFGLLALVAVVPVEGSAKSDVAPLKSGKDIAWSHAPYEVGACAACHERDDPKNPGKITVKDVNELCYGCHEQIQEAIEGRKFGHEAANDGCTNCHNPHNARYTKLLKDAPPKLCLDCHDDIKDLTTGSKVQHDSVVKGRACLNCHNPHSANVEHLLIQLPYDLCVNCHGTDDVVATDGTKLTNMKKLLEENPVHHGPVAAKDCSACHAPHGSNNFRLLLQEYPEKFYATYEPKNYALCYRCHNNQIMANPETTTLTKFRDGKKNLHYKHVHKEGRGRTCRACHEVHASKKPHQIRDGVPYGKSGWVLPIKYIQNKTGGGCEKTCHTGKFYNNKSTR